MKLRNKETGEIGTSRVDYQELYVDTENGYTYAYKSLQKMCEVWEDYEEPKEYWCIDWTEDGGIFKTKDEESSWDDFNKQIGNHFNTREEAEKAAEKLKAWKRLKDKGIRFKCCDDYHIDYELTGKCAWTDETEADLDLLFGGEE